VTTRTIDVFFYGLFMDADRLRRQEIEPVRARRGYVDAFALRIGQRATLVPQLGARSYGMLMALAPDDIARLYAAPGLERYRPEAVLVHSLEDDAVVPALCYNLPDAPEVSERNPQYAAELRMVLEALDFPRQYVAVIA
jgi:hypothetical protein